MATATGKPASAKYGNDTASTRSTAVDLNAGHGTDRGETSAASTPANTRGAPAARSRQRDNTKASPDGEGGGESNSALETESLRDRSSRSDVEGGTG